jgi:hypothetical protein
MKTASIMSHDFTYLHPLGDNDEVELHLSVDGDRESIDVLTAHTKEGVSFDIDLLDHDKVSDAFLSHIRGEMEDAAYDRFSVSEN